MLNYKKRLKLKRVEIIETISSKHNKIKLEINKLRNLQIFGINQHNFKCLPLKEKQPRKLENILIESKQKQNIKMYWILLNGL